MDPVRNPYSPGAGRKPSALVGRDDSLSAWATALRRAEIGRTDQPFVLYGLRGVGKTVLLSQFRRDAEERGWIVAQIEAGTGKALRELLGEALYAPLADIARPGVGARLAKALRTALSFKASYDTNGTWTFGVDLAGSGGGGADTGILDTDLKKLLRDLADAAEENNVGIAILIDEAQDLTAEELTTLCTIAHAAAQDQWPALFAFAGLPSLPRMMTEAKSYAERFQYSRVQQLDESVVAEALTIPAAQEGAEWDADAAAFVVEQSGRYPYFLQQYGQETWNVASGPLISRRDAEVGVLQGNNQLDNGFFRARWDRATPSEQQYLRAMAVDGDAGGSSSEIAGRMRKKPQSLGPTRAALIAKGLIYAPEHGVVAFTVPGMASFIARQIDP